MSYQDRVNELEQASHTQTPMPQYQCHKKAWALKIAEIEVVRPTIADLEAILNDCPGNDKEVLGAVITPADNGFGKFGVSDKYMRKHDPKVGGYYVVYDDGYKSFSPAAAFEGGYTRI